MRGFIPLLTPIFPLLLSFVEKSTLNTAVSQFCSGFTELLDTFLVPRPLIHAGLVRPAINAV